jgi:hypothetical protein
VLMTITSRPGHGDIGVHTIIENQDQELSLLLRYSPSPNNLMSGMASQVKYARVNRSTPMSSALPSAFR